MKTIVITGSTRGIGYGLADAFLEMGSRLVVNGRSQTSVDNAIAHLTDKHPNSQILGVPGDVTDLQQVENLWETAHAYFGKIDIWINNAGLAHPQKPIWEIPPKLVKTVIDANVLGMLYGARVAMQGMLRQEHGQIYIMEGHGSRGQVRAGLGVYGTSKAAVGYMAKALQAEVKGTPVQVCTLSPGMVLTDMVLDQFEGKEDHLEKLKPIFNIIVSDVPTVAPYLAKRVLANKKSGSHISFWNKWRMVGRFLSAPFVKRDLFSAKQETRN
ncbi:MAG: SDR family oxidoreductase [Chloroflexi bacterium]|nr:SDR family oxidoreductase [Chloroflexota bacterium]